MAGDKLVPREIEKFTVEVRVTSRYFVEVDAETADSIRDAMDYVGTLSDHEIMEATDREVDEIEVLDGWAE